MASYPDELDRESLQDNHFCLFRIPKDSKRVIWYVTKLCNYHCPYCITDSTKMPRLPYKEYEQHEELSTETVARVIRELKSLGFTHLKFTGGEPFLRNDMIDIFNDAAEQGFTMDVSTNASLITPDRAIQVARLKDSLKIVHVSLDGPTQEIHEQARGPHTYEPTIKGLTHLKDQGVYVRVGTVIFDGNQDKLAEMVDSAANLRADKIIFSFMEAVGRGATVPGMVSKRSMSDVITELEELAQRYEGKIEVTYSVTENPKPTESGICPAINQWLYIRNDGCVLPCTWVEQVYGDHFTSATLQRQSLETIMQSRPFQEYRGFLVGHAQQGNYGCPVRFRRE